MSLKSALETAKEILEQASLEEGMHDKKKMKGDKDTEAPGPVYLQGHGNPYGLPNSSWNIQNSMGVTLSIGCDRRRAPFGHRHRTVIIVQTIMKISST